MFTRPWSVPRTRISNPHPSPSLLSLQPTAGAAKQAGNILSIARQHGSVTQKRQERQKERWPWVRVAGGQVASATGRIEERARRSDKSAPLCSEIPEHGLGSPRGLEPVSPHVGRRVCMCHCGPGDSCPLPTCVVALRTEGEMEARRPGKTLTSGPCSQLPPSPLWSSGKQAICKLHAHLLCVPSLTLAQRMGPHPQNTPRSHWDQAYLYLGRKSKYLPGKFFKQMEFIKYTAGAAFR